MMENLKNKNVTQAVKGIKDSGRRLPDFITTTDARHYSTWNIIVVNNEIHDKLALSEILPDDKIRKMVNEFAKNVDDIFLIDGDRCFDYIQYFNDREENIKEWLHFGEMYEGLANFIKFDEIYIKKLEG